VGEVTTAVLNSTENERRTSRRPVRNGCRWIRDPHHAHGLICVWGIDSGSDSY